MESINKPFKRKDGRWEIRHRDQNGNKLPDIYRKTKEEADAEYSKLNQEMLANGAPPVEFDRKAAEQLFELSKLAEKHGFNLSEIAQSEIRKRSGISGPITIEEVAAEYQDSPFFLNHYHGYTPSTNKSSINKFARHFGRMPIANFTLDHVYESQEILLQTVSAMSAKREINAVKVMFRWAKKRVRRYITQNVFQEWDSDEIEDNEDDLTSVTINTPEDTEKIIQTCIRIDPLFLPTLTLSRRFGMRTCEILRIEPSKIDVANRIIEISKEVAKRPGKGKPQGRTLEGLHESSWTYLLPFAGPDGKLAQLDRKNFYRRLKRIVCEALGIPLHEYRLRNEGRHSFATYAYAENKDAKKVIYWLGHRSEKMLWAHYVEMSEKIENAVDYFSAIAPENLSEIVANWKKVKERKIVKWPSKAEMKGLS